VFELLKNLFGFIMSNFTSYEVVYGAFAAIPIFLLWIFLSWNIVLIGVEISYALTAFTAHKEQKRHPVIMLLDLMELFYKKQQHGLSVSDDEALDVLGRDEIGRWPSYVLMLEQQNLVKRTDDNQYVLVRNLSQVDFWSFYSQLPYPLPKRRDLSNVHHDDLWIKKIGPALVESDDYLAAKLAIPLSTIFDDKS
jgi:membrane protein